MKEVLNRIKRGELQLYITVIENFLGYVYNSALENNNEETAMKLTRELFLKLYDKVMRYVPVFNAEEYISKNIEALAIKKGIGLNETYLNETNYPQQLLRTILIALSHKTTSKRRKSFFVLIPITVFIFAIVIAFVSQVSSSNKTHPGGTIFGIEDSVELVYEEDFSKVVDYNVTSVLALNNGALLRMINSSGDSTNYIYEEDVLIHVFELEGRKKFLYETDNSDLVFFDENILFRYSREGNLLDSIELEDRFSQTSSKKFIVIKGNEYEEIFDLITFNKVDNYKRPIYDITIEGDIVFLEEIEELGYLDLIDEQSDIMVSRIINSNLVIVRDSGIIEVYHNGELEHSSKLEHYEDLDLNFDDAYYDGMTVNFIESNNHYILSIQSEAASTYYSTNVSSNFEIISKENFTSLVRLEDSLRQGRHQPLPRLTANNKAILVATQYKSGRQVSRFNAVYNLETNPIQEYHLVGTGHLILMDITGQDGLYYVYTYDDTDKFRVYKVSFIE